VSLSQAHRIVGRLLSRVTKVLSGDLSFLTTSQQAEVNVGTKRGGKGGVLFAGCFAENGHESASVGFVCWRGVY